MPTDGYGLQNDADSTKKVSSAQWNLTNNTVELIGIALAQFAGGGILQASDFNLTPTGGTAKTGSVSGGYAIVGSSGNRVVVKQASSQDVTCIGTNASPQTNYCYVNQDGSLTIVQNVMDAPADSHLAWSALCNDAGLSSVNQFPSGRVNLVSFLGVKVTSADRQGDYLQNKLAAGTGITLTLTGSGADEGLTIAVDPTAVLDYKVKCSADDQTEGYLFDELVAGTGISIALTTVSGTQKKVTITNSDPDSQKVLTAADDPVENYLGSKLVAGTNITITETVDGVTGEKKLQIATDAVGGGTDIKAKVSADDTANGYLADKIIGSSSITVTETTPGGAETLVLTATNDGKFKVDAADNSYGYLEDKIVAGTGITLTEVADVSGNKQIRISSSGGGGGDSDELVKTAADDTVAGYLEDKIIGGTNIAVSVETDGGTGEKTIKIDNTANDTDELVKVNADDTAEGYLADKLVAGTGIALTVLNAGGVRTLQIAKTNDNEPYDVAGFVYGEPEGGALVFKMVLPREVTFPASLTGSYAHAGTDPAGSVAFDIKKNVGGVVTTIGSINFAAGANNATFTFASEQVLAAGTHLLIYAPAVADADLADVAFSLVGLR